MHFTSKSGIKTLAIVLFSAVAGTCYGASRTMQERAEYRHIAERARKEIAISVWAEAEGQRLDAVAGLIQSGDIQLASGKLKEITLDVANTSTELRLQATYALARIYAANASWEDCKATISKAAQLEERALLPVLADTRIGKSAAMKYPVDLIIGSPTDTSKLKDLRRASEEYSVMAKNDVRSIERVKLECRYALAFELIRQGNNKRGKALLHGELKKVKSDYAGDHWLILITLTILSKLSGE